MDNVLNILITMLEQELQKSGITETDRMSELGLDSLDTIDLIMRLEERLKVQIGDGLMTAFESMTVGQMASAIEELPRDEGHG